MSSFRQFAKAAALIVFIFGLLSCSGSGDDTIHNSDNEENEPAPSNPGDTRQISQYGVTWTFAQDVPYGRFANGDYWVLGPVTIIEIDPASTDTGGRTINGSMINPSPRDGVLQGYDSAMYAGYGPGFDANLNAARPHQQDLSAGNPLIVAPSSSLVSCVSLPEAGALPQLQTAAILTVLGAAPGDGAFRPAYCGADKAVRYYRQDLHFDRLASLAPVAGTPALGDVERYFERPWLDHVPNWLGGYHHPGDNMPDYGREIADQVGIGALMLQLDFSEQDKETLLIRYVQLGIDLFGIVLDGGQNNWTPDGGHASGRKWPIVMAGIMLDDTDMQNIGPGDGSGQAYFGEDSQTFYVAQEDIDMAHDPDPRAEAREYEQTDLGLPEWGIAHATYPVADNKNWEATYRRCCTGIAWSGFVLAARIMDAKALWGHDALFDYQDRYMQVTAADGAYPGWRAWDAFSEAMWDTYRADYGSVWIP
jgi:hypothetical protein